MKPGGHLTVSFFTEVTMKKKILLPTNKYVCGINSWGVVQTPTDKKEA